LLSENGPWKRGNTGGTWKGKGEKGCSFGGIIGARRDNAGVLRYLGGKKTTERRKKEKRELVASRKEKAQKPFPSETRCAQKEIES